MFCGLGFVWYGTKIELSFFWVNYVGLVFGVQCILSTSWCYDDIAVHKTSFTNQGAVACCEFLGVRDGFVTAPVMGRDL